MIAAAVEMGRGGRRAAAAWTAALAAAASARGWLSGVIQVHDRLHAAPSAAGDLVLGGWGCWGGLADGREGGVGVC